VADDRSPTLPVRLGGTTRSGRASRLVQAPTLVGPHVREQRAMSSSSRFLGIGIALGLAGGLLAGVGLAQPDRAAATTPSALPTSSSSGAAIGAPAVLPAVMTGGTTGTSVASSGTAIAYPYFTGSPGIAPDHTIVVTGVGQANMQSDGSDRAAAQKSAFGAALADARTQATMIASATGLSISGVLSVSASVAPNYIAVPVVANGPETPACVPGAAGKVPQATGVTVMPQPVCPPLPQPTYRQTLSVSVTVAYRVG
jgi:Protein of unknown function (DUF541)